MRYKINKNQNDIMNKIRKWIKIQRSKLSPNLMAEFNSSHEVRVIDCHSHKSLSIDSIDGCMITLRQDTLIISCAESCIRLAKRVISFLKDQKIIGEKIQESETKEFQRKNIRHAHEIGRPLSEQAKIKRKEKSGDQKALQIEKIFKTVPEAVTAAEKKAGAWLYISERAKQTAQESCYEDPDYVYKSLIDLGHTAKYNSEHNGLGTTWNKFLGELGSHDFVPNTSSNTINKYPTEYHIIHNGEKLCIQAHIRKGTGLAKDCLRIYIVQPRKPGDPVIVAQIGAHLPTADRSH